MGLSADETAKKYDKEKVLKDLELMMGEVQYELVALTREALLKAAAEKIPMLSQFMEKTNNAGDKMLRIGQRVSGLSNAPGIGQGFHIGIVALAGFDFFRIPIIYLSAYMFNQKVPFTLENNAKWVYAGVIMALTITAFAFPPAAPVIAFVLAGIGLSASAYAVGRALYERYQLRKEYKKLKKEIIREEEEMNLIQQEAKKLHERLEKATDEQSITKIYGEIDLLQEGYNLQKKNLGELKSKELQLQQKMDQVGIVQILGKSIGVLLGALTIVGLLLALFFPPVGLGILAGVAITAGVYLAARLTAPLLYSFGKWLIDKFKKSPEGEIVEDKLAIKNSLKDTNKHEKGAELIRTQEQVANQTHCLTDTPPSDRDNFHGSTADVLVKLLGTETAIEVLKAGQEHLTKEDKDIKDESVPLPESKPTTTNEENSAKTEEEEDETVRPYFS